MGVQAPPPAPKYLFGGHQFTAPVFACDWVCSARRLKVGHQYQALAISSASRRWIADRTCSPYSVITASRNRARTGSSSRGFGSAPAALAGDGTDVASHIPYLTLT